MHNTWRIPPWLVVGREHAKMAAPHKLLVVHWQHGIRRRQELRMEDDLDAVVVVVVEMQAADRLKNRIRGVVN